MSLYIYIHINYNSNKFSTENGMNIRIYDVKVKNDTITQKWNKGAVSNVIFYHGTVIKVTIDIHNSFHFSPNCICISTEHYNFEIFIFQILEDAPKETEITEVKITGRSSKSLIIRSGGQKRKVNCINDELLTELSQNFPAKRRLIFENDVVTGYEK